MAPARFAAAVMVALELRRAVVAVALEPHRAAVVAVLERDQVVALHAAVSRKAAPSAAVIDAAAVETALAPVGAPVCEKAGASVATDGVDAAGPGAEV